MTLTREEALARLRSMRTKLDDVAAAYFRVELDLDTRVSASLDAEALGLAIAALAVLPPGV